MTPEAEFLLTKVPTEWTGTKAICLAANMLYPGDGSANHNLLYTPIRELVTAGLVEKRRGAGNHPNYTEYRRKP